MNSSKTVEFVSFCDFVLELRAQIIPVVKSVLILSLLEKHFSTSGISLLPENSYFADDIELTVSSERSRSTIKTFFA